MKPMYHNKLFSSNASKWFRFNMRTNARQHDGYWKGRFIIICWFIWRDRNDRVHANSCPDLTSVYARACAILGSMNNAHSKLRNANVRDSHGNILVVNTSTTGYDLYVEVDGAYSLINQHAACGGVLKNSNGT